MQNVAVGSLLQGDIQEALKKLCKISRNCHKQDCQSRGPAEVVIHFMPDVLYLTCKKGDLSLQELRQDHISVYIGKGSQKMMYQILCVYSPSKKIIVSLAQHNVVIAADTSLTTLKLVELPSYMQNNGSLFQLEKYTAVLIKMHGHNPTHFIHRKPWHDKKLCIISIV